MKNNIFNSSKRFDKQKEVIENSVIESEELSIKSKPKPKLAIKKPNRPKKSKR